MKKILTGIIATALAASLFAGCGGKAEPVPASPEPSAPAVSAADSTDSADYVTAINIKGTVYEEGSFKPSPWYKYETEPKDLSKTSSGKYSVVQKDGSGKALATDYFDISFITQSNPPVKSPFMPLDITVAYKEGVASFEILKDTTSLYTVAVTANTPEIAFIDTKPDYSGKTEISWTGTDKDGGDIWYELWYCTPNDDFISIAADITKTSATVDFDTLPGSDEGYFYLYATDGVNTAELDSQTFAVSFKPPEIISKQDKINEYKITDEISFDADVYDKQDGWLYEDGQITWSLKGREYTTGSMLWIGLFITSALIGILNSGIESKLSDLRKGKSKVLEENHVVVLGFNDDVFTIISELITANENQKKACVIVMGEQEKEEIEDRINAVFTDTKTTAIICRSGNISDLSDLAKCSIETCHSVIINEKNDFEVIKSILAVTSILKGAENENPEAYIVTTIQSQRNMEVARLAGEGKAVVLYFKSTISRIIAQACTQPGMSSVFIDLFDFDGDEIYFEDFPQLYGKTMGEIIMYFDKASPIGFLKNGVSMINPDMRTVYMEGDKVILIAADDGEAVPMPRAGSINRALLPEVNDNISVSKTEKVLFLGYNELFAEIITELDKYLPQGSLVSLAYQSQDDYNFDFALDNVTFTTNNCDIYDKNILLGFAKDGYEQIVILSDTESTADESDAKTLMLLLQLRNLAGQNKYHFSITSEMRNVRNQELAQVARVNDFVVSSNITGLMTTQLSQNKHLYEVFEDLLDEDGSEIYFKPVSDFVKLHKPCDLFTAAQALAQKDAVLIGYKRFTGQDETFEIVINPNKNQNFVFSENDMFVVIAED